MELALARSKGKRAGRKLQQILAGMRVSFLGLLGQAAWLGLVETMAENAERSYAEGLFRGRPDPLFPTGGPDEKGQSIVLRHLLSWQRAKMVVESEKGRERERVEK